MALASQPLPPQAWQRWLPNLTTSSGSARACHLYLRPLRYVPDQFDPAHCPSRGGRRVSCRHSDMDAARARCCTSSHKDKMLINRCCRTRTLRIQKGSSHPTQVRDAVSQDPPVHVLEMYARVCPPNRYLRLSLSKGDLTVWLCQSPLQSFLISEARSVYCAVRKRSVRP